MKKYKYYRIKCYAKNQSDHLTIIKNLMLYSFAKSIRYAFLTF